MIFFFTFTSIFTAGTLYTVIVIALFLHILWDAGLHPLTPYTATQHLIVHANLYRTLKKKNCNVAPLHTGAPQASESLSPAFETTEPFNRHNKAWFGTSDMCVCVNEHLLKTQK